MSGLSSIDRQIVELVVELGLQLGTPKRIQLVVRLRICALLDVDGQVVTVRHRASDWPVLAGVPGAADVRRGGAFVTATGRPVDQTDLNPGPPGLRHAAGKDRHLVELACHLRVDPRAIAIETPHGEVLDIVRIVRLDHGRAGCDFRPVDFEPRIIVSPVIGNRQGVPGIERHGRSATQLRRFGIAAVLGLETWLEGAGVIGVERPPAFGWCPPRYVGAHNAPPDRRRGRRSDHRKHREIITRPAEEECRLVTGVGR